MVSTGGAGDVSTDDFEICTVAADCKTAAAAGENGGQFGDTLGYPVVDASGNVWVPDPANRRIQEFDSTGNFIAAYGYGVNGGAALERCTSTTAGVCRAGTDGSGAGQFGAAGPTQIAFDNLGNLYAIDPSNNRVQRFDSAFTTASDFASATFSGLSSAAPEQVAATQGGTRLAFSLNRDIGTPVERQIVEIDPTDGSVKDTSLAGIGLDNVSGLAEDSDSGDLYATTTSSGLSCRRILVLGAGIAPLSVSTRTISVKTDTSATFTGTIDPRGGWVTGCKFEYSTDPRFADSKDVVTPACESLAVNGGFQPVSARVAGLLPNTTYFVRLQASRPLVAGLDRDQQLPVLHHRRAAAGGDRRRRGRISPTPRPAWSPRSTRATTPPATSSSTGRRRPSAPPPRRSTSAPAPRRSPSPRSSPASTRHRLLLPRRRHQHGRHHGGPHRDLPYPRRAAAACRRPRL